MLEAAMFGGIPDQLMQNGLGASVGPYPRHVPRPPSPSLAAQRLIREQQVLLQTFNASKIFSLP